MIVELNPRYEGPLEATGPAEGIRSLSAGAGIRSATLRFSPAFPIVRAMAAGEEAVGEWTLDVADDPALTGGSWLAVRTDSGAELGMEVTRPWQPRGLPLSLKAVTTVAGLSDLANDVPLVGNSGPDVGPAVHARCLGANGAG